MKRPLILVSDFFGSLKARGIPAYVRDLEAAITDVAEVRPLRAPAWFRRAPNGVQNLAMVLHEQIVVPWVAWTSRADLVVFPYNSASFLCSWLSQRSLCVMHDLIPYRRRHRRASLAYLYLLATTAWHTRRGCAVAGVSPYTMRLLGAVARFRDVPRLYMPNCFAATPVPKPAGTPDHRVTLISGHSRTKDLAGALDLWGRCWAASTGAGQAVRLGSGQAGHEAAPALDVVGFGDGADLGRVMVKRWRARSSRPDGLASLEVKVHDLLPADVLQSLLARSAVVWAHSRAEGFGRTVVEGRMVGRPVVMSRLAVFRPFGDAWTWAYRNDDAEAFALAMHQAFACQGRSGPYDVPGALRQQVCDVITSLVAAVAADADPGRAAATAIAQPREDRR
jgi:hypothetical protein